MRRSIVVVLITAILKRSFEMGEVGIRVFIGVGIDIDIGIGIDIDIGIKIGL